MDEFLANRTNKNLKDLLNKTSNIIPVYDVHYIKQGSSSPRKRLKDFSMRDKRYSSYKYILQEKKTAYISNLHNIYYYNLRKYQKFSQPSFSEKIHPFYIFSQKKFFFRVKKAILLLIHQIIPPRLYVFHAFCVKVVWKRKDGKILEVKYNPKKHVEDKNIKKLAEKAKI